MKKINRFLTNYFGITPREANGFLVLSGVIICILLAPIVFKSFYQPTTISSTDDKKLLDSLVAILESQRVEQTTQQAKSKNSNQLIRKKDTPLVEVKLFQFNPNTISEGDWVTLGVPKFIAKRIINYRNKGGEFYYKSDLMKIYGFPESTYQSLEFYIQLPDKREYSKQNDREGNEDQLSFNKSDTASLVKASEKTVYTKSSIQPFEINSASMEELQQISGIGEKLSARIINFRDKLGGFYNEWQIRDTYGLDSVVCNTLLSIASIDKSNIKKISINTATEEDLKSHPYISYNLSKIIVKYRKQHGNYTDIEDLKKIKILKVEILQKLEPYLSFE